MSTPNGLNGALSSSSIRSDSNDGVRRVDPYSGQIVDSQGIGIVPDDVSQFCRPDIVKSFEVVLSIQKCVSRRGDETKALALW